MARAPAGNFVQFLHEDRAGFAQFLHNVLVVYDFFADVDRRAVEVESDFDDIDGPDHAGTKTSRLEQEDFLVRAKIRCERLKRHNEIALIITGGLQGSQHKIGATEALEHNIRAGRGTLLSCSNGLYLRM